jgi:YhcH/YjgK/YiaL family protein
MILDNLHHASLYKPLSPRIALALDALMNDLRKKPIGRYEIQSDQIYAMVQTYTTKPQSEGKWEAHQKYIDIQYILAGTEVIGAAPLDSLKEKTPYDPTKDVAFYEGQGQFLTLHANDFMILYPHDAHMPQIAPSGNRETVQKIVLKAAV